MKAISQTRKKKSGWYSVILKILLTPELSEEAEKTGAQERTEGKVRIGGTKGLSEEVEQKDDQAKTGDNHPETRCSTDYTVENEIVVQQYWGCDGPPNHSRPRTETGSSEST